jgi:hypothetical protein
MTEKRELELRGKETLLNKRNFKDQQSQYWQEFDASARPDLRDPQVVLSLLEADQVVAAKQQTRFGRRPLSLGIRVMLWGLRTYVVIMLILVVISVLRALHGGG